MTTDSSDNGTALSLQVLDIANGVETIYEDWLRIQEERPASTLFQFPGYFRCYAATFGAARNDERIIAVYRGTTAVALIPVRLVVENRLGMTVNVLKFADTPIPLHDAILSLRVTWSDVVSTIRTQLAQSNKLPWDVIALNAVLEDGCIARDFSSSGGFLRLKRRVGYNNFIDLSQSDYISDKISAKLRKNLRRSRKRLADLGDYTFETVDQLPALNAAFEDFLDIESSGWKSRRGGKRAVKLHADQTAFYSRLMQEFSETGDCNIHLLKLDGKTIAANFAIRTNRTFYSLKSGYDESLTKIAPGQVLREYVFTRYSADELVETCDLISDYPWQSQWRPTQRKVYDFYLFNKSVIGLVTYAIMSIRFAFSRNL